MNRRRFLGRTLAGMGAMLASYGGGAEAQMMMPSRPSAVALPEGQPLRGLSTLANMATEPGSFSATLAAGPASVSMAPGLDTSMWLYNATAPGPLLELQEGQHVRIRFENHLPRDTTVHWHGLAVPPEQDGNPMDPVPPGAWRFYEFDVPAGSAGTYWYHPHAHRETAEQVARGLVAPLIVRAAEDPLGHVPEVTMLVSGLRLGRDMQIAAGAPMERMGADQAEALLVNGSRLPVHTAAPGATQRLRILNATGSRYFRVALEGHELTLVGTDGGLLEAPIEGLAEVLLAPAQRIEVIVNVRATPGARYRLRALAYEPALMGMGMNRDEDLLVLATSTEPALPALHIPGSLRHIAKLDLPGTRQRVELGERMGMGMMAGGMPRFLVNGRTFDMNRVDLVAVQGQVEQWEIVNRTSMDHPIHIHGTQFQLVSREVAGIVTPAPYLAWLDTVNVPSRQSVAIRVRHALPGKRLFHCHILAHEDAGMMGVLEVRPV